MVNVETVEETYSLTKVSARVGSLMICPQGISGTLAVLLDDKPIRCKRLVLTIEGGQPPRAEIEFFP